MEKCSSICLPSTNTDHRALIDDRLEHSTKSEPTGKYFLIDNAFRLVEESERLTKFLIQLGKGL